MLVLSSRRAGTSLVATLNLRGPQTLRDLSMSHSNQKSAAPVSGVWATREASPCPSSWVRKGRGGPETVQPCCVILGRLPALSEPPHARL